MASLDKPIIKEIHPSVGKSGQLIKSSNEKNMDLSTLNSGVFLVVIETENKNHKNIKIVKL